MMTWSHTRSLFVALIACAGVFAAPAAVAQGDGAAAPPDEAGESAEVDRAEDDAEEQAAETDKGERSGMEQAAGADRQQQDGERSLSGGTLALVAYLILWALVFGFIYLVMRRQRRLDDEVEELEARLDRVFDAME